MSSTNKNSLGYNQTANSLIELVSEFVSKDKDYLNELNNILIRIKNRNEEFLEMMKALGPFLTNTNDILRKNSVKLIALTIERVNCLRLQEREIKTLFDFSFGKMKDVVCAPFAVKIIYCKLIFYFKIRLITQPSKQDLFRELTNS